MVLQDLTPNPMKGKSVRSVCGFILFLFLALAIGCEENGEMKIKELRESLVLGMDRTEIEDFLTKNKIEHSFISYSSG